MLGIVHLMTIKAAKQAVVEAANRHMPALLRRRAQLLTVDANGTVQTDKWVQEIEYFYNTQISGSLSEGQRKAVAKNWADIVGLIESQIGSAAASAPAFVGMALSEMTPGEFEASCAERLRRAGWNARVIGRSGDQGVDVIAERGNVRVALQCKLYSTPIGNKAVQEIVAGRVHYDAQHAAVVSNRPYTPSAEQLARSSGGRA